MSKRCEVTVIIPNEWLFGSDDEDVSTTCESTVWIAPAEPDVGLMHTYLDEYELEGVQVRAEFEDDVRELLWEAYKCK